MLSISTKKFHFNLAPVRLRSSCTVEEKTSYGAENHQYRIFVRFRSGFEIYVGPKGFYKESSEVL